MPKVQKKYNQIYNELRDLIGEENMYKVYENFKGMQVSFPSRLYTKEYMEQQIKERYNGHNGKELAREFGYTVKYFNQLIKEIEK
ncbi:MAG: Mor transcription activator family protein [Lachnospiraceae bacterium]|nr:Mor transcription activator family protein [Lachnospiraceae bacterium]